MKKLLTLFTITALISFSLVAQNRDTKKADKLFSRFEFVDAAKEYAKLAAEGKGNLYVYRQMADSYYNIFNTEEAEKAYEKTIELGGGPEMIYKYAQMLKANGKYKESNVQMAKFAEMRPSDDRAITFNENPDYLPKILKKGKKFNIQNLDFNSKYSDFGGTLKDGKLYITSGRNESRRTYGWSEEPFLDIYEMTKNEDGSYQAAALSGDKINTKYHEGLVSFSPDGNTMYFSRESYFEKGFEEDSLTDNKISQLHLFRAKKSKGEWSNVEGFPINKNNYSVKNPSVSADGKTLYFSSNMPGGYGLFDIYKASINADGSLGTPVNLGQKVNTQGQEMFPFIGNDNTIYFSSTGHLGLGNLDVFYTKEIDGKMGPIRNMGVPVNSNADDFAFRYDDETGNGYISSNREGGVGGDDVYAIKKLQPFCDVLVTATITDSESTKPIEGALVSLFDSEGNAVETKSTDDEGIVEFIAECGKEAELKVVKDNYENGKVTLAATEEKEVEVSIMLDPIALPDPYEIKLNPIYFDFDKSNVTAKAAFELDNLVQIMNKYPELTILATSHTDSRGSAAYNEKLSDRRAKTTAQYIISKGIDKSRITGIGKGENEPKVDCGANCTEEEHQMNRRSQFLIVEDDVDE